jgi:hypothetical protein
LLKFWIERTPVREPVDCLLFKQISTDCPASEGAGSGMLPATDELAAVVAEVVLVVTGDGVMDAVCCTVNDVGATTVEAGAGTAANEVEVKELTGAVGGAVLGSLAGAAQPAIVDVINVSATK